VPLSGQPGDAILRSLLRSSPLPATPSPAADVSSLIEFMAARVLVSEPGAAGGQEVRILLKEPDFPGLEIRMGEAAGGLRLTLLCRRPEDMAALQPHLAELLRRLRERLGRAATVDLALAEEGPEPAAEGQPLPPFSRPSRPR
jgi:type III secretion system needle length determinant